MNHRRLLSVPALLLLGATSTGYSPVGCCCVDENEMVADIVGVGSPSDLENPVLVRNALRNRFEGKDFELTPIERDYCAHPSFGMVTCRYWLWKKPGYVKSLNITMWVADFSKFIDARVSYEELSTAPPSGT